MTSLNRDEFSGDDLIRKIEERRNDAAFMGRLRALMDSERDVLDRLADDHPTYAGTPTHMSFVGGTIYCSVKGGRLNLGKQHRYGRSFTCPHCHAFVAGRLDEGSR